jgi:hypothetical protein
MNGIVAMNPRATRSPAELAGYGVPELSLQVWRDRYPTGLNQLEIAAVNHATVRAAMLDRRFGLAELPLAA